MSVHTTPQDAYWKFFESLNARDAAGWAGVMSYPHVRVSPEGAGKIFRSAEEYAADALWEPVADAEMVRTQGLKPTVVHEEVDKVHLAGGWTRFRPDGDPILKNRVTYILTRVDDGWGIQARFGVDSVTDEDVTPMERISIIVVRQFLDAWRTRAFAVCARQCHFPVTDIGISSILTIADAEALASELESMPRLGSSFESLEALQSGKLGVNVAATVVGERGEPGLRGVFLVAGRAGRWGIVGISRLH